jgi:hypothetical protein
METPGARLLDCSRTEAKQRYGFKKMQAMRKSNLQICLTKLF